MNTTYHSLVASQIKLAISRISDEEYNQKLEILNDHSLGQHFRHILEFYLCLFQASTTGIVNYDKRKRDLEIETNRNYALEVAKIVQNNILELNLEEKIGLEMNSGYETTIVPSNFSRELIYLSEHTIHHFALIKIGLASEYPHIVLGQNFGVAESTIAYKRTKV